MGKKFLIVLDIGSVLSGWALWFKPEIFGFTFKQAEVISTLYFAVGCLAFHAWKQLDREK